MSLRKQISNKKRLLTFLLILLYTCIISLNISAISTQIDNESLGLPKVNKISITIISHDAYTVGYDTHNMIPLWVQWHINKSDLGSLDRDNTLFDIDPQLSNSQQAHLEDFRYSGFDRGHICPNGDRNADYNSMVETFYLTNIVPQNHQINEGIWKSLEDDLRSAINNSNNLNLEAFVISGTYGIGGWNNKQNQNVPYNRAHPDGKYKHLSDLNEFKDFIPEDKRVIRQRIAIPEYLWKCIIIVPQGPGDAVTRINSENTVTVSVMIPNKAIRTTKQKSPWNDKEYLCSISQIEKKIGYKLFPNLTNANDIYEIKNRVFSNINIQEAIKQIQL